MTLLDDQGQVFTMVTTMVTWSIIDEFNQPHAGLLRQFIFSLRVDRKPESLLNTHSENSTVLPLAPQSNRQIVRDDSPEQQATH